MVWGHHMFTVGMDVDVRAYFTAVTLVEAVPTGVKVFLAGYSLRRRITPFGRISSGPYPWRAILGLWRLNGAGLVNAGVDLVLRDTYCVVAHFHYVLSLGAVFGAMAAVTWGHMGVCRRSSFLGANGLFPSLQPGQPSSYFQLGGSPPLLLLTTTLTVHLLARGR